MDAASADGATRARAFGLPASRGPYDGKSFPTPHIDRGSFHFVGTSGGSLAVEFPQRWTGTDSRIELCIFES
jgi:hypothetical protein